MDVISDQRSLMFDVPLGLLPPSPTASRSLFLTTAVNSGHSAIWKEGDSGRLHPKLFSAASILIIPALRTRDQQVMDGEDVGVGLSPALKTPRTGKAQSIFRSISAHVQLPKLQPINLPPSLVPPKRHHNLRAQLKPCENHPFALDQHP